MSNADRGKVAERLLHKEFSKLAAKDYTFDFERIKDARSSRGAMSDPRAGDFQLFHKGTNTLIECKEVAHDYRLPKVNFPRDQRARAKKRQYAGSICWVAIYSSTREIWRLLPLDFFGLEETGSWDLREIPEQTMKQILEVLYVNTNNG